MDFEIGSDETLQEAFERFSGMTGMTVDEARNIIWKAMWEYNPIVPNVTNTGSFDAGLYAYDYALPSDDDYAERIGDIDKFLLQPIHAPIIEVKREFDVYEKPSEEDVGNFLFGKEQGCG